MKKSLTNVEIAELLRDIAASYKLKNEAQNRFKIVAYERAADSVEHLSSELKDIWDDKKLDEVPGIGKSIADSLDELFRTGKSSHFDSLLKDLPKAMFELMKLKGVGPKSAYRLVTELKISNTNPFKDLEEKIAKKQIEKLEGFGKQSQEDIKKALEEYKTAKPARLLLPYARQIADEIIEWMNEEKSVKEIEALGSLRRSASTIGDIDLASATDNPQKVIERFVNYKNKVRTLEKGNHSASILLPGNIRVDIMVTQVNNFGSLLQHFTGSKHHNIALREYAIKKGLSVSDYGIKRKEKLLNFKTEKEFYNFLGLDYIPPELREDQGEIQKALDHKLPNLVEIKDIKGDLQIHSDFDIETSHDIGQSSMEEVIEVVNNLHYEYVAFTEHNPSKSKHSESEILDILKRKKEKIEKINYSLKESVKKRVKKVFNSLEIDILSEGNLPVSEKALDLLDFALVSIHSSFDQERNKITNRILRSFDNPKIKIFAHPTARILNKRESINVDWEKIFEKAKQKNIYLEINADPSRFDLPDILIHEALKYGVKFSMGTDAHNKEGLYNMKWGISVARRGWVTESDIINTLSLEKFEEVIK
ncbi:DNA polymerase/3'-5' exonuclease PolX [Candidatus Woesebacteria bacterium]|nr:DNA polymerase/3'-5' exonuclease PolX [Candidatus Woesebacteria bacterium]QQG47156.1 MAG: DNA polymerase/3'-5' exonuclease PolX [Candidatus Woesebacteria bacterium]